jgi:hypothetical protein
MLPTFLVLGAMKAGTTALYRMLDAHPDVFMSPVKEPNFFAFAGRDPDFRAPIDRRPDGINHASITDRDAYEALFADADSKQPRGEASHTSLYWPNAAATIERLVPAARLVAILRNPVERAYSEYMHFVRDGDEPISDFGEALDAEPKRIAARWAMGRYVDRGRYDEQLARYLDRFDRDQLLVLLHDDLVADPEGVAARLFAHVGADPTAEPVLGRRVNASGIPHNRWLHRALTTLQPVREALAPVLPDAFVNAANALKNRNLDKPPLHPAVRARLEATFRPHIERLASMLDRDLSQWHSASPG